MEPLIWRVARLVYGSNRARVSSRADKGQRVDQYPESLVGKAKNLGRKAVVFLKWLRSLDPFVMRWSHRLYRPYTYVRNTLCVLPMRFRHTIRPETEGINVIGDLRAETGLGQSARCSLRAAQAVGLPVVAADIVMDSNPSRKNECVNPDLLGDPRYDITLLHANPNQLFSAIMSVGGILSIDIPLDTGSGKSTSGPKNGRPC